MKKLTTSNFGPFLPIELTKAAKTAIENGIVTVAYTFIVFYLCKEMIKVDNIVAMKKACNTVRFHVVQKHKVPLSSEIDTLLLDLERGDATAETLLDIFKKKEPEESVAATEEVKEPRAALADKIEPAPPAPSAPPTAVEPIEPAPPAPLAPSTAVEPAPKRMKLSERMKRPRV